MIVTTETWPIIGGVQAIVYKDIAHTANVFERSPPKFARSTITTFYHTPM